MVSLVLKKKRKNKTKSKQKQINFCYIEFPQTDLRNLKIILKCYECVSVQRSYIILMKNTKKLNITLMNSATYLILAPPCFPKDNIALLE